MVRSEPDLERTGVAGQNTNKYVNLGLITILRNSGSYMMGQKGYLDQTYPLTKVSTTNSSIVGEVNVNS